MNIRIEAQARKMTTNFDYMYKVVPSESNFSWAQHTLDFYYLRRNTGNLDYGMKFEFRKQYPTLYDAPKTYTIVGTRMVGTSLLHQQTGLFILTISH